MTESVPGIAGLLARAAAAHHDRPAVRLDDQVLTHGELYALALRAARFLRERGVRPGDRVALMLPNVPEFAVLYYGILSAGAVVVPVNPLLKAGEIGHCLRDAEAALLLAWHAGSAAAAEAARRHGTDLHEVAPDAFRALLADTAPLERPEPCDDSDTAVILYTSGTTGSPKGAELTHANIVRNTETAAGSVLGLGPTDVIFGGLPLFHSFGQVIGLNCAVASGASLTLLTRFDAARAVEVMARDRVTVLAAVPTMYNLLLALGAERTGGTDALRVAICGGAPLPAEVLHGFESAYDCPVLEGYGLSESSPLACINRIDRVRRPGTIGYPIDGVRMKVTDRAGREVPDGTVGEIRISGHNVMKGYWKQPAETDRAIGDGWLRTGDLGTRDADGCFRIVGRSKEVILRGGMNVYPREVEEVLYAHPAVAEAAVIGVPDPVYGEEVGAAVVLKAGAEVTGEELREYVRAAVAPYKYPRVIWFPGELPKGATGKILKRAVVPPPEVAAAGTR
ncbi:long-chain-fatty-acid--CoA ligase [Streptomyces sp. Ru73]|uniref:long-chain-fatty-acid--CoA ligase n=1 Tax=Streptomyces sp. Ru73 TaxID=2080748 RepID=UPI000CDCEA12|nr:long-chain fatty acid--CoA ligase [Streptomyces sp. Ru73]POX38551.1 long-chain-fatty-acid--CoA ligase [Streptomyces sp. Ru73]